MLHIIDLRTSPARTYLLEDRASRTRLQIQIEGPHPITAAHAHYLVSVLLVSLVIPARREFSLEYTPGDRAATYRLTLQEAAYTLTFFAEDDVALDGDPARWSPYTPPESSLIPALTALAWYTVPAP